MAWKQWDLQTRNLFRDAVIQDHNETWSELNPQDKNFVRGMFDYGFINNRISTPVRVEARNRFYDELGIDPTEFDWTAWRLYMGYSDD